MRIEGDAVFQNQLNLFDVLNVSRRANSARAHKSRRSPDLPTESQIPGAACQFHTAGAPRKRSAVRARAFAASTWRSRGGELVTSDSSNSAATRVTSSTARLKAASLAFDGLLKPLSFRTN